MSNSRIQALPIYLANQIAAGEVIERPASVVKELVENSIDAGATQINIDIEGAGNQLIRVSDNGFGIHQDDLTLALSRHATSKLNSSEQLSKIDSLGFRGEALPSIASIAQFSLTSRQADNDCAWQIINDETQPQPASHPTGTTIEVRDLFFNLPARRRFLRSKKTEQNHILTSLYRLALSRFDIGFNCQMENSSKLKLPAANSEQQKLQRLAKLCGQNFIDKSIYIEQSYNDIQLHGWLGQADAHRPQTDVQYFFINGRVIRDRVINHAIRLAFGEQIPSGRHPAFVLYLELPLDKVDVNVHPTKHEVRFREARLIHGLITSAIEEGLTHKRSNEPPSFDEQPALSLAIDEPNSSYQKEEASRPPAQQANKKNDIQSQSSTLLQQRYFLVRHQDNDVLLDLQKAEQQLKRQQFLTAVETESLSTRPVLVPLKFSISAEQHSTFNAAQTALQPFGFDYTLSQEHLKINQIPSLFSQINMATLIEQLSSLLTENSHDSSELATKLSKLIPLTPISSTSHAEQLIQQLTITDSNSDWCCILDQTRLSTLFSS